MEVAATPPRTTAPGPCDDDVVEPTACEDGVSVLAWVASRRGAERLLNRRNLRGDVPLHCVAGDSARAAILLRHPAAVDVKNNYGRTPLLEACYWDHTDVATQLIAAGADLNAFAPSVHNHGDFPLLLAVRNDNPRLVKRLCLEPTLRKNQTSMIGCPFGLRAVDFARSNAVRVILKEDPPPPHVPLEDLYGCDMAHVDKKPLSRGHSSAPCFVGLMFSMGL
jgi:ankyrin repeat protein